MKGLFFTAWFVLLAAAFAGCVDPEIGIVDGGFAPPPPPPGDAATEAGEDAPEDLLTLCKRCMATVEDPGPGCQASYEGCIGDTKCNLTLECIYESGCFGASPRSFLGCGTPCGTKAGIFSGNDPSVGIATKLFYCVTSGACKSACFTEDL
jgi:hypothetical protein